ncbi:MAG: alpha/beta hydrolase [Thaumarchaeota archaeon]|nr:alpha/beta hydrolase [Nitrososphaerota archaeon]
MSTSSSSEKKSEFEVGSIDIRFDFKLRRMLIHNPQAKGTVLLLHGFPETIYTWDGASQLLAKEYEVHAFDWPGYGLSTRPSSDKFSYSPRDYAGILKEYIVKAGIHSSKLLVYATDIGALPALLLALQEPHIIQKIVVGDFAPFDRPQYMFDRLRELKIASSSEKIRNYMNANKEEILENAFKNGLEKEQYFEVSKEFKEDMNKGWNQPNMTSVDAFYYYYSFFTRDQNYFESNVSHLKTPIKIIWGEKDFYIKKEMGLELANKLDVKMDILEGVSHYPHLQNPKHVYEAINSFF